MFNLFDKNIIFNIFEKLNSWSVLSACMVSTRSHRLCIDKDVARRLLDAHYPNACHTDDPWSQYVALASNVYTFYETTEDTFDVGDFHQFSGTIELTNSCRTVYVDPSVDPSWVQEGSIRNREIWIRGLPVSKGKKLWIMYLDTIGARDTRIYSFKTKEALAEWVVNDTYKIQLDGLLSRFYDYGIEIDRYDYHLKDINVNDIIHDNIFIEMMENYRTYYGNFIHDTAIPFTKENYYKSIMKRGSVDMFFNRDCIHMNHVQF